MPTLDWIGKRAVVNHHRELPYRLLHCDRDLSAGDAGAGNLLVEGDNLHALKALLPYYAGRVKCIYIDPPYNTGNEGWVYNDNVNAPEIQKWLHHTVGKEAEDLSRHDKWLCMMYPRLALLREFLREDGVIMISIGRDELAHLRMMCDEIFGYRNLIEILIWNTEGHTENQEEITGVHEYVLVYASRKDAVAIRSIVDPSVPEESKIRRDFAENSITKNGPKNPPSIVELPVGFPCEAKSLRLDRFERFDEFKQLADEAKGISRDLTKRFDVSYPIRADAMVVDEEKLTAPCRVYTGWSSADKLREFIRNDCQPLDDDGTKLAFYLSKNGVIYYRREGRTQHYVPSVLRSLGTTEKNRYMLERMGLHFLYPKPLELVSFLISLYTGPDDLILDSFAGSATTGHAVLALNKEGGNRRFILAQMPYESAEQEAQRHSIARELTAKRLSSVIAGYGETPGLGGGFRFYTLGEPMLDEDARFHPDVAWDDLGHHLWFAETGEPWSAEHTATTGAESLATGGPMLGVAPDGRAIYLLHSGLLGAQSGNAANVLTPETLTHLVPHAGQRVVYGEACTLRASALSRERIIFKQIPYQVRQL